MISKRPHTLHWTGPAGESTIDPEWGVPVPGLPGEAMSAACMYQLAPSKQVQNKDSVMVFQNGNVYLDNGSAYPDRGSSVVVMNGDVQMFAGEVVDVFVGQLGIKLVV